MSLNNFVRSIRNVMRGDAGINGDAQRIEQMVWLLFLKVYDAKEEGWAFHDEHFVSIIPEPLRWHNWAVDKKDGAALTGDALLTFVNESLFPQMREIVIDEHTPINKSIVKSVLEGNNNYMKDGILLRQVVNIIDAINFSDYDDRHAFGELYETILKEIQSAGSAGEYYTPRAVTDFMVEMLAPKLGEKVADFACGTGGFLTSTLKALDTQIKTVADRELYNTSIFGVDKKPLPYLLCVTNMLLHDIDCPNIVLGNSLEHRVQDYTQEDKFDIVIMNPPYGGGEKEGVKINFPADLRSSETADLFLSVIMYRLKRDGRAAVILPDGFLFGADNAKTAIKKKLLTECNLHTIIRLPGSVFAPYTSITTNILFFDKKQPSTTSTWIYRMDMPEGYKHFSKTKPISLDHFAPVMTWWENRISINEEGFDKAREYTLQEIITGDYTFDLCGFPHVEEIILPPDELIANYQEKRTQLDAKIDQVLQDIKRLLGYEIQD